MLIILTDSKGIKSNSEILEFSILLHDAVINKKTNNIIFTGNFIS